MAQDLTGGTTSRVGVAHRILMGAKTFMAEERRAGDLDQATREEEEVKGEGAIEEGEGMEGTGVLMRGSG